MDIEIRVYCVAVCVVVCVAVCCSVLSGDRDPCMLCCSVRCSVCCVFVAVCCSVLSGDRDSCIFYCSVCCSVCCSVLQCVEWRWRSIYTRLEVQTGSSDADHCICESCETLGLSC